MVDYKLNGKITLSPKFLYTHQSRGRDLNFGALVTYNLTPCSYVNFGGFHRWKDAGIVMLGYGWRSFLVRASMDINTSSLSDVGNIPDAGFSRPLSYEIGIVYTGLWKKPAEIDFTVPCGIF